MLKITELLRLFQMYLNEKKYTSKVYTGLFIPLISTECSPWYTHLGHTQGMFIIKLYHYSCAVNIHIIPLKHLMFILFALHNFQTLKGDVWMQMFLIKSFIYFYLQYSLCYTYTCFIVQFIFYHLPMTVLYFNYTQHFR